jgi:hypothetical protein
MLNWKDEMRKDICKGCQANVCLATLYDFEEGCPCIECLVKPICIKWCDIRLVFINTLNRKKGIIRDEE